jgi:hypothetical protein
MFGEQWDTLKVAATEMLHIYFNMYPRASRSLGNHNSQDVQLTEL